MDVESNNFYDKEQIKRTIYDQIKDSHRLGAIIADPEYFHFSEFEGTHLLTNKFLESKFFI